MSASPKEPLQDEDANDNQSCGQWKMMQAKELMAKLRWNTFIAGKCVGLRNSGNRQ